ncbi:MAG: Omp28-related outer membrane protein, partial [Alistipes sp.]
NYEHNNVVREMLSMSLYGDKLGTMTANQELTKKFSKQLNGDWKPANMRVLVCALNNVNDDFCGNNSAVCPLNGSVDYKYNE